MILHVVRDPRAAEVLEQFPAERQWDGERFVYDEAVEALVSHDLAPIEWTDREWSKRHWADALRISLHNPQALVTAETLLREGINGTGGEYVGLRSWEQLLSAPYSHDRGRYLSAARASGFFSVKPSELAQWWVSRSLNSGSCYGGYPGSLAWRCADQILGGPPWVASLYQTGFGLWCWEDDWGSPKWALIARDGEGLPWPELKSDCESALSE